MVIIGIEIYIGHEKYYRANCFYSFNSVTAIIIMTTIINIIMITVMVKYVEP